ncbi:hypothetical protein Sjap_026603 [Stephania japonica]|uniref:Uncharacterized protein n=1 Tax=Stephania japonica TaxID=461633 RepID=A0AAP0DUS4_9MAGN
MGFLSAASQEDLGLRFEKESNSFPRDLSVPVSLTRSGLLGSSPRSTGMRLRRRSSKGDDLIWFYLSVFSLGKQIKLAKPVSKATFASIITPVKDMDRVLNVLSNVKDRLWDLVDRYCPSIQRLPLNQGLVFEPTWKALPTHSLVQQVLVHRLPVPDKEAKRIRSCFVSFPFELAAWQWLMQYVHVQGEQWSQGALWAPRVRFAGDKNKKVFSNLDLEWFKSRIGPDLPSLEDLGVPPHHWPFRLFS